MEKATRPIRFVTEQGVHVRAVDSAQMREVDRIAVEETGPNLYQMMVSPFDPRSWVRLRNGEITDDSGKTQTTGSRRTS